MSVLLDIAVSSLFDATPDNQEIEKAMQILRTKKNEFFEACMKSPARDLIRETPH